MFKIFLKLLGVTRTRIRILGSGSVKKNSSKQKMQMIRDPDVVWIRILGSRSVKKNSSKQMIPDPAVVRIRESYQIECECIWIRILESGFRNFYADHRFASDTYHTVRIPSSGSDWARTSHVCKGFPASRSSMRSSYALQPDHAIQVRQVQTR
jgi:hypothetical protein